MFFFNFLLEVWFFGESKWSYIGNDVFILGSGGLVRLVVLGKLVIF